ncbi:hypothetical protein F5141DRAFT_1067066 [Pisolithus sp. B1]|nr:hypothetical protein F5141DRAFT_1067066 [Pisolithus sp. B1]
MKLGYKSQRPLGLRSNVEGWRDADSSKLLKVPGESSRSQALKVDGIEVAMAEPSSLPLVEEEPLTVRLQGDCLQGKLEEQSKEKLLGAKASVELEATEALGDSPVPQSEYLHPSSSPHADILPQNPPIEPQDAQDEPRTDEQPIEAVVLTLKVPKPTPEPRDDLCEVPEQAGHTKVEEIKLEVEIERQSKVKGLDSFIDIFAAGMDLESWCRDTCNKSKRAYDAAMKIYASLSYKSKNYLFEGYEILGGKAIWSATSSIQGYKAGDQAKAKPRAPPGTQDKTQSAQRFSRRATSMRPPHGSFVYSSGCSRSLLEDTPWSAFMKPQTSRESEEVVKIFEAQRTPPKVKR